MAHSDEHQATAKPDGPRIGQWLRIAVIGRNPKKTLLRIVVVVAVSLVVSKFVLLPIRVEGISMYPTYRDHTVDFVNRLVYLYHSPQRGDVVGIRAGGKNFIYRTPGVMYLKRIVGLPGETVRFKRGKLFINGTELDEPYEKFPCDWNSVPTEVGTNQFYVVGDNRTMPEEYHFHGKVEKEQIVGKVLY